MKSNWVYESHLGEASCPAVDSQHKTLNGIFVYDFSSNALMGFFFNFTCLLAYLIMVSNCVFSFFDVTMCVCVFVYVRV